MSSFHLFAQLPAELQTHIWSFAAQPRMLQIAFRRPRADWQDAVCVLSSTPCPAVMHACRGSRANAPYEKAFAVGLAPRYVWTNFATDMICVNHEDFLRYCELDEYRTVLQRLRLMVHWDDGYVDFGEDTHQKLREFPTIREMHIQMMTMRRWIWHIYREIRDACPPESVRFIVAQTGLMLTGPQLELVEIFSIYHSWDEGRARLTDHGEIHLDGWLLSELHEID